MGRLSASCTFKIGALLWFVWSDDDAGARSQGVGCLGWSGWHGTPRRKPQAVRRPWPGQLHPPNASARSIALQAAPGQWLHDCATSLTPLPPLPPTPTPRPNSNCIHPPWGPVSTARAHDSPTNFFSRKNRDEVELPLPPELQVS